MIVIRDCTGTYLQFQGKDYHVCNIEKLSSFAKGITVNVTFKKVYNCKDETEKIVCKMYHENEGWVKILKVK